MLGEDRFVVSEVIGGFGDLADAVVTEFALLALGQRREPRGAGWRAVQSAVEDPIADDLGTAFGRFREAGSDGDPPNSAAVSSPASPSVSCCGWKLTV